MTLQRDNGSLLFAYSYGLLPVRLLGGRAPLVHVANSWYAHVVPLLRSRTIVTCHDLIELAEVEDGTRQVKPHRRFHVRAAFRGMTRADLIACDSEATAAEVRKRAPECESSLRVVYCGIDPLFTPGPPDAGALARLGVTSPYVLYVGSEQPRKNVPRLVEAVSVARRRIPDLRLVKVGGHQTAAGRAAVEAAIERAGMGGTVTILDSVADVDLLQLYRGAGATVLISLREGFGYPPLESMASGTPAIVSNRDSLPEVVGDAALVVDPLDTREIAGTIERLVGDVELRRRLGAAGLGRSARFTWKRAVDGYRRLYEDLLH